MNTVNFWEWTQWFSFVIPHNAKDNQINAEQRFEANEESEKIVCRIYKDKQSSSSQFWMLIINIEENMKSNSQIIWLRDSYDWIPFLLNEWAQTVELFY